MTISAWRSTPGSPRSSRPRRTRSPANSRRSSGASRSDALECDPELCFVDDGVQRDIADPPGARATPGPGRRRGHRSPLRPRSGSVFTQICISGFDRRRTRPLRRRGRLPLQSPRAADPEENLSAPGPGHDRRVRAGQDHGAQPPRQAARRPPRFGQRAQRRAPTDIVTSASTRAMARHGIRSWPRGSGGPEDLRVGRPGTMLDR